MNRPTIKTWTNKPSVGHLATVRFDYASNGASQESREASLLSETNK